MVVIPDINAGAAAVPPAAIVLELYVVISFITNTLELVTCPYVVIDFGGVECPGNVNVHVHAEPLVIVGETPVVYEYMLLPLVPFIAAPEPVSYWNITCSVVAVPELADVTLPYVSTVTLGFVYVPAVTPVVSRPNVIVPLPVIGEPLDVICPDVPATVIEVTVPEPPLPPAPLLAAVMRPNASTVIFALVYEPAATDVVGKSTLIVPLVVIGEPVTVNVPPVLEIPAEVTVPDA